MTRKRCKADLPALRIPKSRDAAGTRNRRETGQMTVEFAVAFPVLIVLAIIAANALLFFSECASFDNAFRDAVRVHAASPSYSQNLEQSRALVALTLTESFNRPFEVSHVCVEGVAKGHVRFSATLEFYPTLFGLGLRSSVFGVPLPALSHTLALVIDCYKPGVCI